MSTAIAEPPKKDVKVAETKDLMNKFMEDWIQPAKKEPKEDKPKPDEKQEPVKEALKVDAPKEDAPKKEEPVKAEAPKENLAETLGRAVRDVGRVVSDAVKSRASEAAPQKEEGFKLPAAAMRRKAQLETLEKLYPDQYAGKAKQWEDFAKRQSQYEEDWLEKNPGKQFNPDDEEHNDFFESDPFSSIDPEHVVEAEVEQKMSKERVKIEQRIRDLEIRSTVAPAAQKEGFRRASNVIEDIGGKEMAGILNEDGTVNREAYDKAYEADPLRAPVVASTAEAVARLTSETARIFRGAVKMDTERNDLHLKIAEIALQKEARMAALDSSKWKDPSGRRHEDWLPAEKFNELSPSERKRHWTFNEQEMVGLIELELSERAKDYLAEEEKRIENVATKRGFKKADDQKGSQIQSDDDKLKAEEKALKPSSPSAANEPKLAGVKGVAQDNAKKLQQAWVTGWIG